MFLTINSVPYFLSNLFFFTVSGFIKYECKNHPQVPVPFLFINICIVSLTKKEIQRITTDNITPWLVVGGFGSPYLQNFTGLKF